MGAIVPCSDNVTRVMIFGGSDWTRGTLRKIMTLLDSSHVFHRMTRLDSSRSHFYKISQFLMDKSISFAHKEISIFCFSDDQDWGKFSVMPV